MQKEKQFLFENLKRTKGLEIFPSSANFFLCKLNNPNLQRADRLNALLFHRGIAIRCCDNFRGLNKRFFRIAVRTRDENKRLILSLSKILA